MRVVKIWTRSSSKKYAPYKSMAEVYDYATERAREFVREKMPNRRPMIVAPDHPAHRQYWVHRLARENMERDAEEKKR